MKFYEMVTFSFHLTPESIVEAAKTLTQRPGRAARRSGPTRTNGQAKLMSQAAIARDEAYRKLAEEAISLQRKRSEDLSDPRNRVAEIERMLREVE